MKPDAVVWRGDWPSVRFGPCWLSLSSARNHFQAFVPTCGALGPTGALQLCAHCQFLSPASLESLLVRRRWPSHVGALGKFVFAWIVTSITDWQPWQLTSMGSGWTLQQTFVYPSATTQCTPATSRSRGLGCGDWLVGATTPLLQVGPRVTRTAPWVVVCAMPTTALSSTTSQRARATTPLETCGRSRVASLPARLPPGLPTPGSSTLSMWPTPRGQ